MTWHGNLSRIYGHVRDFEDSWLSKDSLERISYFTVHISYFIFFYEPYLSSSTASCQHPVWFIKQTKQQQNPNENNKYSKRSGREEKSNAMKQTLINQFTCLCFHVVNDWNPNCRDKPMFHMKKIRWIKRLIIFPMETQDGRDCKWPQLDVYNPNKRLFARLFAQLSSIPTHFSIIHEPFRRWPALSER